MPIALPSPSAPAVEHIVKSPRLQNACGAWSVRDVQRAEVIEMYYMPNMNPNTAWYTIARHRALVTPGQGISRSFRRLDLRASTTGPKSSHGKSARARCPCFIETTSIRWMK